MTIEREHLRKALDFIHVELRKAGVPVFIPHADIQERLENLAEEWRGQAPYSGRIKASDALHQCADQIQLLIEACWPEQSKSVKGDGELGEL